MITKKILVTGGAGFLGRHLCDQLLAQGHHVICLDNFHTGRRSNIESFMKEPLFTLLDHDVCDPLSLDVDEIYNLACPASPIHYQTDPVKTVKTCVMGAINMLDLARQNGAKILQASTSEVYGDPQVHPQNEAYWGHVNPIGLRSCYDEGKRCAETLFYDYHRQYGVNIRVLRIFNTYGPYMQVGDGRVISNFIVQALTGQPITIYGEGQQTRSFCYRDDLIRGMIDLMGAGNGSTDPVNIGNPTETTILQLATLILDMTGSSSELIFKPLPQDDPQQRQPDIKRAKDILGWTPKVSLQEGLVRTIAYFEATL